MVTDHGKQTNKEGKFTVICNPSIKALKILESALEVECVSASKVGIAVYLDKRN